VTKQQHPIDTGLIHEMRTPLNQIIGYSELLAEQAQDSGQPDFVSDLQKIRTAGKQLLNLIDDNFHPILDPQTIAVSLLPESAQEVVFAGESLEAVDGGVDQGLLLVVDDNEANRDVLSRRLERQGYTVATAENGRKAIEMLSADAFDLVLLDIMMPEMDGYEVLQLLKADAHLKHIPVIMISALSELDSVARCIEMGAEDYLFKPFNPTLLKARIHACLEKKQSHDREANLFNQLQDNYQRLQELEKLRDDLTNMIVHDMRTPLTSVITGMQTLDAVGSLNEDQQIVMSIALGGGNTLLAMINDLLEVEKSESETMQLDSCLLCVATLVDAAAKQLMPLADVNELNLVQSIPTDLPPLEGDEDKLRRILVNLIGNAIKFTHGGGTVTVEARHSEEYQAIVFSVTDTGEGIPPESLGRIFEKFGQVESRKGGRTMSTGLGLTFCRLAVEAHGGNIGVESVLGEGSKFSFTIPLTQAGVDPTLLTLV
jgi:two-component system sensor histidine kinase/response regulator